MRANFVPFIRRFHVHVAVAIVGATTLVMAVSSPARTAQAAPERPEEGLPPGWFEPISEAEPTYNRANHELLWGDTFDAVAVPTTRGRYGRYLTLDARTPQFDPTGGIKGSGALRIDWRPSAATRGSCADDSNLIEAAFPPAREIFVTFSVRYSPNFVFDWSGRGPCSGNAKKLFLLWAREGSRFVYISENGALGVGSDHDHPLFAQNRASLPYAPRDLADGAWHRITLRIRQGSTPSAPDGLVLGWIDGELHWRYDGIVTHNSGGYYLFKMPATFNSGSPVAQTEWLDNLEIWRTR
jgi:hypothetical protein